MQLYDTLGISDRCTVHSTCAEVAKKVVSVIGSTHFRMSSRGLRFPSCHRAIQMTTEQFQVTLSSRHFVLMFISSTRWDWHTYIVQWQELQWWNGRRKAKDFQIQPFRSYQASSCYPRPKQVGQLNVILRSYAKGGGWYLGFSCVTVHINISEGLMSLITPILCSGCMVWLIRLPGASEIAFRLRFSFAFWWWLSWGDWLGRHVDNAPWHVLWGFTRGRTMRFFRTRFGCLRNQFWQRSWNREGPGWTHSNGRR